MLHNHNPQREYLNCWFDTDTEEDGPGSLDDFVGLNAARQWVMRFDRWAGWNILTWDSWAIEIIGQPVTGADEPPLPLVTGLNSVYPNPFNSTTVIHYSLASGGDVTFKIYDITGAIVKVFEYSSLPAGHHQVKWDGCNSSGDPVASGIYFARMTSNEGDSHQVFSRKITLLK